MSRPSVTATARQPKASGWRDPDVSSGPVTVALQVSPELAQLWLSRGEPDQRINRPPHVGRVERYTRDMVNGDWVFTGHPLVLDERGLVRDGRQRLLAVVKSDVTVLFNVVFGVPSANQRAMDKGRGRSFADD